MTTQHCQLCGLPAPIVTGKNLRGVGRLYLCMKCYQAKPVRRSIFSRIRDRFIIERELFMEDIRAGRIGCVHFIVMGLIIVGMAIVSMGCIQ